MVPAGEFRAAARNPGEHVGRDVNELRFGSADGSRHRPVVIIPSEPFLTGHVITTPNRLFIAGSPGEGARHIVRVAGDPERGPVSVDHNRLAPAQAIQVCSAAAERVDRPLEVAVG